MTLASSESAWRLWKQGFANSKPSSTPDPTSSPTPNPVPTPAIPEAVEALFDEAAAPEVRARARGLGRGRQRESPPRLGGPAQCVARYRQHPRHPQLSAPPAA